MTVFYHGTAWAFERFTDYPLFFTPDFAAAAAYACDCRVRVSDTQPGVPVVLAVELDTSNFLELDRAAFLDLMEIEDEREQEDSGCWEALLNYAFEKGDEGYAGILVRGVYDYCGSSEEGRQERCYDQAVVMRPELLAIGGRTMVSENDLVFPQEPVGLAC